MWHHEDFPHSSVLETVLHSLKDDKSLETILPYLCFSHLLQEQEIVSLLKKCPSESTVWHNLEDGLSMGKSLPPPILALLYQTNPQLLMKEVLRILEIYTEEFHEEKDSVTSKDLTKIYKGHINDNEIYQNWKSQRECMPWKNSPLYLTVSINREVFKSAFNILCEMLISTYYSINCIEAAGDFIEVVKKEITCDLCELFPEKYQHLVFLLTVFDNCLISDATNNLSCKYIKEIESSLLGLIKNRSINEKEIRCILCFFPKWNLILIQSGFICNFLPINMKNLYSN